MDQSVSVSKGVFVFKNETVSVKSRKSKATRNNDGNAKGHTFTKTLWYKSYKRQWKSIEDATQHLTDTMSSEVLQNLIEYINVSHRMEVRETIPAAVLLTGINTPDHSAQFVCMQKEIKAKATPHVINLQAQNCQNVKSLMDNIICGFINHHDDIGLEDADGDNDLNDGSTIKKSQSSMAQLSCWYEKLYHKGNKKKKRNLVVILEDFESFDEDVLQTFILILSTYVREQHLPIVMIFGVATSFDVLHKSFKCHVSSRIDVRVFASRSSTLQLDNFLDRLLSEDVCFHLGGQMLDLLIDVFLFYDLSVSGFVQNLKLLMLEHYSYGNAMALCAPLQETRRIVAKFDANDCENVRRLLSFRRLIDSRPHAERIKLLLDDDHFKRVLIEEIEKLHDYMRLFHLFLRCLHVLVADLPKSPLGQQLREIYSLAISNKPLTSTTEYKQSLQLLMVQSHAELIAKCTKILDVIKENINGWTAGQSIETAKEFYAELSDALKTIEDDRDVVMEIVEEAAPKSSDDLNESKMTRQQLKKKLMTAVVDKSKPMTAYERNRKNLIDRIAVYFARHLHEPRRYAFHEIFFFAVGSDIGGDYRAAKNRLVGAQRAAVHVALDDPGYYLKCQCCCRHRIVEERRSILRSMPDISIVYKLHLEHGKSINLFDWLQSYLAIVDPIQGKPSKRDREGDEHDEFEQEEEPFREIQPELHARFAQSVAELERLGFVKTSKRKMDHVTRLTWGG